MQLFLTHVDTPYRMYRENLPFSSPSLMLSEGDLSHYDKLTAICALWCEHSLTDEEGWQENRRMRAHVKGDLSALPHLLSVEDARILGEHPLARLEELWCDGVRVLTPMWHGVNRLGGAFNTQEGLTTYGKHALSAAMERGMLIDLSHASEESARDILVLARHYKCPVLATHSNFRAVCPHPRNLSDAIAYGIVESGGQIGLCLVPSHVGGSEDLAALISHYRHGLTLGLGAHLVLGTDLDGTDKLISPLEGAKDLLVLAARLRDEGIPERDIHALFSENATRFFAKHSPCRQF